MYTLTRAQSGVEVEVACVAEKIFEYMNAPRSHVPTAESITADNLQIAGTHLRAGKTVNLQIENKELLSLNEFCEVLDADTDWLQTALDECRVFAITGPGGRSYYPAFYGDAAINREHLVQVTRMLALLDPRSQYLFYTTINTSQSETPLDALRAGRLGEVITSALRATADAPQRASSIIEVLSGESWPPKAPPRHAPSSSFTDVLNGA